MPAPRHEGFSGRAGRGRWQGAGLPCAAVGGFDHSQAKAFVVALFRSVASDNGGRGLVGFRFRGGRDRRAVGPVGCVLRV